MYKNPFDESFIKRILRYDGSMKHGYVFPIGEARVAAEYAREAEQAGWDGFFVWEPVWGEDPWVMLGACAMVTEKIRLGTLLTAPGNTWHTPVVATVSMAPVLLAAVSTARAISAAATSASRRCGMSTAPA